MKHLHDVVFHLACVGIQSRMIYMDWSGIHVVEIVVTSMFICYQ